VETLERCLDIAPSGRLSPAGTEEASVCVPEQDGSAAPRTSPVQALPSSSFSVRHDRSAWTLGISQVDDFLPTRGLKIAGVHEVKPRAYGDWPAALGFAAMLSVRRLDQFRKHGQDSGIVLWCWTRARAHDLGQLYAPGLQRLGLSPRSFVLVETDNEADVLWAIEEGLKSRASVLVVGCLADVELTPARRLSLAVETYGLPCLLLTDPRASGTAAVATRWRIANALSSPHPFDSAAPGKPRLHLGLERVRGVPIFEDVSVGVEWCNDTHRFSLVAGLADRALETAEPGRRAGRTALRSR
jgi:protein ImuA